MRVYVAGPYTADPAACTARAIAAGDELLEAGHEPFVPHLAHYWHHLHAEHDYEAWMRLDLAWVAVAEALVRLPGESSGADREVALAEQLGIPVFASVEGFLLKQKLAQERPGRE